MKAMLISIKPKFVADILNGKKTIEIRKTMPKCDLPIDVYIYCTKGRTTLINMEMFLNGKIPVKDTIRNGKVVAKFTLNKVDNITYIKEYGMFTYYNNIPYKACLTEDEMIKYLKGKRGYAWHISNLVIFDRPKELSDFRNPNKKIYCKTCIHKGFGDCWGYPMGLDYCKEKLTKAPQSWCYVEVE